MRYPSPSSRFSHPNIGEQYRSLSSSLCSFLHSPVTSSLLGPNILPNTLFSNTLSLRSSLNVSDQVSHPYKTTGKIIFFISLSLHFLIAIIIIIIISSSSSNSSSISHSSVVCRTTTIFTRCSTVSSIVCFFTLRTNQALNFIQVLLPGCA